MSWGGGGAGCRAVIAQDHGNWPLTVRDNIIMGRRLDEALLASAAASSGADTVIAELARGYDTLLARQFKDGAELSGGQWQRIAAAGFLPHCPAADYGRADRRA